MPVVVWGNGTTSEPIEIDGKWTTKIPLLADAQYVVCDDFVPYPRKRWRRKYYQRISVVGPTQFLPHLPLDSAALAQKIREANKLLAVDELIFPLSEGEIANLESAIPLIGSNDQSPVVINNDITREYSEVVFAVAGDIQHPSATRFFQSVFARNAALRIGNRPGAVKVAWEGYHTCSVWGVSPFSQMYNELRIIDRGMLDKATQYGLNADSWMLQTAADSEHYADVNNVPHYAASSYDPDTVKKTVDEDCFYEALLQGMPVVGVWIPYSTEGSRENINDAIRRAVRRKYPSGPRDQG